ncbi:MAG: hypothetical protein M3458_07950 [Acidobacteriota bacterium]|nr:hypothetical protein [Acidobacteriota bacterium]
MELTITVPKEVEHILEQKAAASGQDIKAFVESIVNKQALYPVLDEILAPARKEFIDSGMTEDELDEIIKGERRAMWVEKHGKKA